VRRGVPDGGTNPPLVASQRLLLAAWGGLVLLLAVRAFAAGALGPDAAAAPPLLVPIQLDVNRAGTEALQALPGIGAARAEAIVLHRVRHGPFRSLDELDQVDGLGIGTIDGLRPYLRVGDFGAGPTPR
jgi:competence protein ComEA